MNKFATTNNGGILSENDIEELLEISNVSTNIKKEFEAKYQNIVERKNKRQIIKLIQDDLVKRYYNISLLELEILSNNIYYYACLIANNISKDNIIIYISLKNINYYKENTNKQLEKLNSPIKLRYIKYLINKYVEIIKNT